jgi:thioredoxin-like negative regulator of GroEL
MSPQDIDAFFNLGFMYAEEGRNEEAVRHLAQTDMQYIHM